MEYSADEKRKIMGPNSTEITLEQAHELLDSEPQNRPRIYGLMDSQIVKLASLYYLEKYPVEFLWVSNTTVADLISRA